MFRSLLLAFVASVLFAQTPAFEVAAIKPSQATGAIAAQILSGKFRAGVRIDGDRVDIGSMPLSALIQVAYKVKPYQVSGPAWMAQQRFDILAKMPEGASRDQVPEMLQALLTERFNLSIHRESREHPVYALVVGKGGPKLEAASQAAETPTAPDATKSGFAFDLSVNADNKGGAVVNSPNTGKMRMSMGPNRTMTMEAESMTMAAFADQLSTFVDRPVMDLTELKGSYKVALELSMDDLMRAAQAEGIQIPMIPGMGRGGAVGDAPGGSALESVQKLGLRLEPRKMPVDFIVVDRLEKVPTEN